MGRNPTPTAVLDARGAYIAHPEMRRPNEPQVNQPLGGPPKILSEEHRKLWRRIAKQLPPGVGKVSDRDAFALMVKLQDKEDKDTITDHQRTLLIKLYGLFGKTPADRSKISIESPPLNRLQRFLTRPKPATSTPAVSDKPTEGSIQ